MKPSHAEVISEGSEGPAPRTVREFPAFLGCRGIWMKSGRIRSDQWRKCQELRRLRASMQKGSVRPTYASGPLPLSLSWQGDDVPG